MLRGTSSPVKRRSAGWSVAAAGRGELPELLEAFPGDALQIGAVVGGAVVTEVTFAYPGLGWLVFQAVSNNDYFLLQGIFLFIIAGVLIANFLIDIVYVMVDPRTRVGISGA